MAEMTAIKLNQLKKASEAYAELRTLHTNPVTEEVDGIFPAWSLFRDDFIADWTSNRIIVDEKEADAMFDTIVENAIQEIETAEAIATGSEVETPTPVVATAPTLEVAPVVVKRRGRPAGKLDGRVIIAVDTARRTAKKVRKAAAKKTARKVAAKKKSGGSVSSKAQV